MATTRVPLAHAYEFFDTGGDTSNALSRGKPCQGDEPEAQPQASLTRHR